MAADQPGGRAALWREVTPPISIEGLADALPATTLELSHAWLSRVTAVRRNRQVLQSTGELDGLSPAAAASRGAALAGVLRIPVIPVRYADVEPPFPTSRLDRRLFGRSVADTVSYADYWREVSGGLLRVEGEVTPWVELTGTAAHYLPAERYGWAQFGRIDELRSEALVRADSLIDFGGFDNDGPDGVPNSGDDDGFVDFVAFVYALPCPGDARTGAIWPHRAAMQPLAMSDSSVNGGPIKIADYVILPAVDLETCGPMHIGLLAHETGHALGLPDLYDYDGSSHGIGDWGLMGTGSHGSLFSPAHLSAWEKEQLGWVRVTWLRDDTAALRIAPVERDRTVYRYDVGDGSGRYLLLENRQRIGSDSELPGHGLLAWQVDPVRGELGIWNRDEFRTAVGIAQSVGLGRPAGRGRADPRDPLPGVSSRDSFRWTVDRDFTMTAIAEAGDIVRADIALLSTPPALVARPSAVHLTAIAGGLPARQALTVEQQAATRTFTTEKSSGWLSVGESGDVIMLTADPAKLPPGEYRDTLRLVDGSGNNATRVPVSLQVVAEGVANIIATDLPWG
ncbi:MAG: M6 family metalloprotease domain-containing protein, partial [Longimicrobiales bacterium]